jgi:HrpA-like RNA helicase
MEPTLLQLKAMGIRGVAQGGGGGGEGAGKEEGGGGSGGERGGGEEAQNAMEGHTVGAVEAVGAVGGASAALGAASAALGIASAASAASAAAPFRFLQRPRSSTMHAALLGLRLLGALAPAPGAVRAVVARASMAGGGRADGGCADGGAPVAVVSSTGSGGSGKGSGGSAPAIGPAIGVVDYSTALAAAILDASYSCLSPLGRILSQLPVEPWLGKLLVLGVCMDRYS